MVQYFSIGSVHAGAICWAFDIIGEGWRKVLLSVTNQQGYWLKYVAKPRLITTPTCSVRPALFLFNHHQGYHPVLLSSLGIISHHKPLIFLSIPNYIDHINPHVGKKSSFYTSKIFMMVTSWGSKAAFLKNAKWNTPACHPRR